MHSTKSNLEKMFIKENLKILHYPNGNNNITFQTTYHIHIYTVKLTGNNSITTAK